MFKLMWRLRWVVLLGLVIASAQEVVPNDGASEPDEPQLALRTYGHQVHSDDWFDADMLRPLPIDDTVSGLVTARRMHLFAARYTAGASGAMKLRVSAVGDPMPSTDMPLSVSVRNSAGGYSFSLPTSATRKDSTATPATSVSRILCPSSGRGPVDAKDGCFVTLGVGGGAGPGYQEVAYGYELRLSALNASMWFLETDAAPRQLAVSVTSPIVFQYRWPDDPSVRMVRVGVASGDASCAADPRPCVGPGCDPHNEGDLGACATLAVQRPICPLTLSVGELRAAASRHLTFTACGTTVVKRDDPEFADGFFVSVLLHEDDSECYPEGRERNGSAVLTKSVRVTINRHEVSYANIAIPVVLAIFFMTTGAVSFALSARLRARFASGVAARSSTKDHRSDGEDVEEEGPGLQTLQPERSVPEPPVASNLRPSTVLITSALIIVAFGINSVATDVRNERRTGSMDTCYRNDLCRQDGATVPDLNHVLSNLPYMGAGIGFLFAVYAQQRVYAAAQHDGSVSFGVPHDFSLFASLGVGLMLEGVTSGLYHVCPNNRNSHIDFFFIYYLYGALGAKLFQTRRGVTSRFHYTPALLVAGITLLGSLQDVVSSNHAWWSTIMVIHIVCASIWAFQMYLAGYVGLSVFRRRRRRDVDPLTRHIAVTHFVLNVTLAVVGLAVPSIFSDLSMYALLFFTLNSGLYIIFYMIAKKAGYRETPSRLSMVFLVLGLASLVPALVLFVFYNPYNTVASAALSRTSNAPCFAGFFDAHDVWHFLSAAALFFMMMGILTLDDDLLQTPRHKIPVF